MPQDARLHKAAYKGEYGAVETCLDEGDDVNSRGAQNRTALHRAVSKGHNDVVKLLIQRGADLTLADKGGLSPLHWAALFGHVETGQLLIEAKASINDLNEKGETPLHLCAEKGNGTFVDFLLTNGADANIADKSSPPCTAFDLAKKNGHKDIAAKIKEHMPSSGCCVVL